MEVAKELKIDRHKALRKITKYFICFTRCGRQGCGEEQTCEQLQKMNEVYQDIIIDDKHCIRKEVAVLLNGFHGDN